MKASSFRNYFIMGFNCLFDRDKTLGHYFLASALSAGLYFFIKSLTDLSNSGVNPVSASKSAVNVKVLIEVSTKILSPDFSPDCLTKSLGMVTANEFPTFITF